MRAVHLDTVTRTIEVQMDSPRYIRGRSPHNSDTGEGTKTVMRLSGVRTCPEPEVGCP